MLGISKGNVGFYIDGKNLPIPTLAQKHNPRQFNKR
jgi:hypothetical protein